MSDIIAKKPTADDRVLEGGIRALEDGIEWIIARELAPMQNEIMNLRAFVLALHDRFQPS